MTVEQLMKTLSTVAAALPEVGTEIAFAASAYSGFKAIWLAMNPGKTEDDFRNYLQASSQLNVDDTAVLLTSHGFVETSPGTWTHTVTPAAAA